MHNSSIHNRLGFEPEIHDNFSDPRSVYDSSQQMLCKSYPNDANFNKLVNEIFVPAHFWRAVINDLFKLLNNTNEIRKPPKKLQSEEIKESVVKTEDEK